MSTARFVDQLYHTYLGRAADQGGLTFWSQLLDSGAANAIQVTQAFLNSPEFADKVEPLARLYAAAFHRIPDAGGLAYWLQRAQAGLGLDEISRAFAASGEFQQRYGALDDSHFLSQLYTDMFGQAPDAATLAHWQGQQLDRAGLLSGLANAPAYVAAESQAVKVIAQFHAVLGQAPTEAQLAAALAMKNPGALLASLYASPDYQGEPVPGMTTGGSIVDGYVRNAVVFVDSNHNGQLDSGELSALSDHAGRFQFSQPVFGGTLVSLGGIDTSTGKPSGEGYRAPAGASVLNPLTSVLAQLVDEQHLGVDAAQTQLLQALGLPSGLDLLHTDLLQRALSGDGNGLAAQRLVAQLDAYATLSGALLSGSGLAASTAQAEAAAYSALAAWVSHGGQGAQVLNSAAALATLVAEAAASLGASAAQLQTVGHLAGQTGQIIAQVNSTLAHATGLSTSAAVLAMATISANVDSVAGALRLSSGSGDLGPAVLMANADLLTSASAGGSGGGAGPSLVDLTAPTLLSANPGNGGTMQANANLVLSFTEAVQINNSGGQIILTDGAVQTVFQGSTLATRIVGATDTRYIQISDSGQVSISGSNVTINPSQDLVAGLNYKVIISNNALSDAAGNPLVSMASGKALAFSATAVPDTTPPTLTGASPADDSTGYVGQSLSLSFSESVQAGTGNIVLHAVNGSVDTATTISVTDTTQVSFQGNSLTLTPTVHLNGATNYYVNVDSTAVRDMSNNAFAGISDSTTLNFSTGAIDNTPPTLTATSPAANATEVTATATLNFTFSEPVKAGTGYISINNYAGDSRSFLITDSTQVSFSGNVLSVHPSTPLANNSTYAVTIDGVSVYDNSNNPFAGTGVSTGLVFKTRDTIVPTATLGTSASLIKTGETLTMVLSFSEPVTGLSNSSLSAFTASGGTLSNLSGSGASYTATFTPNADTELSSAKLSVDFSQLNVRDAAGNQITSILDSSGFKIDTKAPTLLASSPADNSASVAVSNDIVLTFSEAMAAGGGYIHITNGSDERLILANDHSQVSFNGATVTINPLQDLSANGHYHVEIDGAALHDLAGNPLAAITSSTALDFWTPDTIAPTASLSLSSNNLSQGGTAVLHIDFSESVTNFDSSDLSASAGTLSSVSTTDHQHFTATYTASSATSNGAITLNLSGVDDLAGNHGVGSISTSPITVSASLPAPSAAISLSDAALGIGEHFVATISFNTAVTDLSTAAITAPHLSSLSLSSNGAHTVWTLTGDLPEAGEYKGNALSIDLSQVHNANNVAGSGSVSSSYDIDLVRPTATLSLSDTTLTIGDAATLTVSFSEAVEQLSTNAFYVEHATLSNPQHSADYLTWTLTLTPDADSGDTYASSDLFLDLSQIHDRAGNAGNGSAGFYPYLVDTHRPHAEISIGAEGSIHPNEDRLVYITFGETIPDLSDAMLHTDNGSIGGVYEWYTGTYIATLVAANTGSATVTLDQSGLHDNHGNAGSGSVTTTVTVTTLPPPAPEASLSMDDKSLKIGDSAQLTISFNTAVPTLSASALSTPYLSVSNLSTSDNGLTWTATLTPDSHASVAEQTVELNLSSVQNSGGISGSGLATSAYYVVDTVRPSVTAFSLSDTDLRAGEVATATITFSEAVSNLAQEDFSHPNVSLGSFYTTDSTVWTFAVTPYNNSSATVSSASLSLTSVFDEHGNAGSGSYSLPSYTVDTTRPHLSSVSLGSSSLTTGATTTVTFVFDRAVSGFDLGDVSVQHGTLSNLSTSNNTTFTATLTSSGGNSTGNVMTVNMSGLTAAGNGNPGSGSTDSGYYDVVAPHPTATVNLSPSTITSTSPVTVMVTFSEAVTGFTSADISSSVLSGGTPTSSDGIHWYLTMTPSSDVYSSNASLSIDLGGVASSAYNQAGSGSATASFSINTEVLSGSISLSDTNLLHGETALVTLALNHALSGTPTLSATAAGGSLGAFTSSDNQTWYASFTPNASLDQTGNTISVNLSGLSTAHASGSGSISSPTYAVHTVIPTATLNLDHTSLKAGQTAVLSITFSEAVSGLDSSDFSLAGGSLSGLASTDQIHYMATYTPGSNIQTASGQITLDLSGVTDSDGNTGSANPGTSFFQIDTRAPTATVSISDTFVTYGDTPIVNIRFSEAVSGMSLGALSAAHGSFTNLVTYSSSSFTASYIPDAINSSTDNVTLSLSGISDTIGNSASGTASLTSAFSLDTICPTLSAISMGSTTLTAGQSTEVHFTFSESVYLDDTSIAVPGGTLTSFTENASHVWTATFTPSSNTETSGAISVNLAYLTDDLGNPVSGIDSGPFYIIDTKRPTVESFSLDSTPINASSSTVTAHIVFSEDIQGFTAADFSSHPHGSIVSVMQDGNASSWTAVYSLDASVTAADNVLTIDLSGISDMHGNAGSGSASTDAFLIDNEVPSLVSTSIPASVISSSGTTLSFTFSEALAGDDRDFISHLQSDQGSFSSAVSSDSIHWTVSFTPTISSPGASLSLSMTGLQDQAGNTFSATPTVSASIDTVGPTVSMASFGDGVLTASELSAGVTLSAAIGIDASSASLIIDGHTYSPTISGYSWTYVLSSSDVSSISDGSYTASIVATDAAGNHTSATGSVAFDRVGPSVVTTELGYDPGNDFLVNGVYQSIKGTASETWVNGATAEVSVDGGSSWTAANYYTGTSWETSSVDLSRGGSISTGTLLVRLTDVYGNVGPTWSHTYSLDTSSPSAPTAALSTDTGESSSDKVTNSVVITGTTEPYIKVTALDTTSSWTQLGFTNADASGHYTIDLTSLLSSGTYTLSLHATDLASNQSLSDTSISNVVVDKVAPTVVSTPSVGTLLQGTSLAVQFDEDIYVDSGISISIVDTTTSSVALTMSASNVSHSGHLLYLTLPSALNGLHNYQVTIVGSALHDLAGNAVSGNVVFSITGNSA
ncbi:Ig-like domain-containing protein [Massilia sp. TS11]|uniref:Ig-like domain-containing protein n=1 Tax=Massilia sp. TS11 TaxID=2908003 RepID=UPI001EDC6A48|nr:Ig-like domain-containing protein [Massilia sp. TS11]MCG2585493.1 Ig-like domain-containing protein [Massilia sp. TS11]